ncbi:BdrQ protein [Borrelia turicatae]|uniref:BdrQ protein n=1 Tax=Borrelia turicatae TaxID=142 RepID=UPI002ED4D8BE
MSIEVEERVNDEDIAKSAVRPERVKKDYHSVTFDGQIISYYVLEEKFDIFQDRMLDNFHYLDDKINIFRNDLNEKIDGVETRLNEKIETVKNDLNKKIDGVETRLNEKINKLDARIDKLDEKIEFVKTDLVQINSRLTLIESKLGFKGQLVSSLTVVAALAASYFVAQLFVALGKYLGIS